MMSMKIVMTLVDAGESSNSDTIDLDNSSVAKIIDVGSNPASIGQLLEVISGLVIASNEDGQHGSDGLAIVIFVKAAHGLVFVRNGHARQI